MTLVSSLRGRIFLASALLAVLSIGAAIYVVNERVTREAERSLQRQLEERIHPPQPLHLIFGNGEKHEP